MGNFSLQIPRVMDYPTVQMKPNKLFNSSTQIRRCFGGWSRTVCSLNFVLDANFGYTCISWHTRNWTGQQIYT